jgi:hypothetical protein
MDSPTEYATGQDKRERNKGQYFHGRKQKEKERKRGRKKELIINEEYGNKRHQNNGRKNENNYFNASLRLWALKLFQNCR